jgi:hypothetical protein
MPSKTGLRFLGRDQPRQAQRISSDVTPPNLVWSKAMQLRMKAMRSQVDAALNICSTADNALMLQKFQLARQAIGHAKRTALWVRVHLDQPDHVPAASMGALREGLAKLERQVFCLERRLKP